MKYITIGESKHWCLNFVKNKLIETMCWNK